MKILKCTSIDKLWGRTTLLPTQQETWYAEINKDNHSSVHRHERKSNQIFVISGTLLIGIYEPKTKKAKQVFILRQNESITIEPNIYHWFYSITDVNMIETYHASTSIGEEDIIREAVPPDFDFNPI